MPLTQEQGSLNPWNDQVVLVTGAGRGLGRAIACALAAQGAILAVNDLTPINLDETVRLIASAGGRVKDYVYDVALQMPVTALVAEVLDDWGRIDVLVNAAGVAPRAALLDMDEWDWRRTIDVNLTAAFFLLQAVGRAMRRQGGGAILNLAGPLDPAVLPGRGAYLASKQGLIGLTRAAALELAPAGIRVNALCRGLWEADEHEPAAGRSAACERAVAQAMFLCSPQAAGISGQVFTIDG